MDLYINTTISLELESNNITVRHADLNISLNGIDTNPINGTVILSVNGNEETVNVTDGKATVELKNLNDGINTISVSFNGSGKYLESEESCLIEVRITNVNLSISLDDVVVGEASKVQLFLYDEFNNPLSLDANITVNDKVYPVQINEGKGSVIINPIDEVGKYTVAAAINCDGYEGNTSCEAILTVYGIGNVTVKHTGDGDALDIQRAIDSANPGDTIQLGNYIYTNVSNINITKDLAIAGNEETVIASAGDGNPIFNLPPKSNDGPQTVSIRDIEFKLNSRDIVLKAIALNDTEDSLAIDTQAISITNNIFELVSEGDVAESIDILYLESERGILSPNNIINISANSISAGINPFEFEVTSISSGDGISIGSQNITPKRKATKIIYNDMLTTAVDMGLDGRVGEWFNFTLVDEDGTPIPNTPMEIGFNGKIYNAENEGIITDENGTAKLQINLGSAGSNTFAISFLGNDEYDASFAVARINVTQQKGSLTVPNRSYSASAKTKAITATLKSASGKPVRNKEIIFIVAGKYYSAKTNAKGVATVNVSLNKKGTYSFTAKFANDVRYAAVNKTARLIIK